MRSLQSHIEAKRREYGDKFDASGLAPQFIEYFESGARIEVESLHKLDDAFEYLRPRMTGESLTRTPRNAESEAGSILALAMETIVHEQYALVTYR